MGLKYEFTDETINYKGHLLHRIRRLSDSKLGGWIESEANLSQDGDCQVDDEVMVYSKAQVSENAQVYGHANVHGEARIYGNARIFDYTQVCGNTAINYQEE